MEMPKRKCELCSMDATHLKTDAGGVTHYYCHHHAPTGSQKIMGLQKSIKSFIPLIIIFAVILAFTIIVSLNHPNTDFMYVMRHFEGAFFVVFGAFKFLNLKGFVDAYQTYDIVAKRSRLYAYAYPFIEIALGLAFLTSFNLLPTSIITFILMLVGSIGVAKELAKKNDIPCACLGVAFKIPMTKVTLVEDVLMGVMSGIMIISLVI